MPKYTWIIKQRLKLGNYRETWFWPLTKIVNKHFFSFLKTKLKGRGKIACNRVSMCFRTKELSDAGKITPSFWSLVCMYVKTGNSRHLGECGDQVRWCLVRTYWWKLAGMQQIAVPASSLCFLSIFYQRKHLVKESWWHLHLTVLLSPYRLPSHPPPQPPALWCLQGISKFTSHLTFRTLGSLAKPHSHHPQNEWRWSSWRTVDWSTEKTYKAISIVWQIAEAQDTLFQCWLWW